MQRFSPASFPDYDPTVPIPRVDDALTNAMPAEGVLHAYMAYASDTSYAPALFQLGAILPAFAYAAASRGIEIGDEGLPCIWTCLMGGSASGKSSSSRRAREFIQEWLEKTKGTSYIDPYVHLDGSMPGIIAFTSEFWDEALNATVCIYEQDEISKLLGQREPVAETLCQLFDGDTKRRHLKSLQAAKKLGEKVQDTIKRPRISACFATVRASLREVAQGYHFEGGLFSRVLWFEGNQERQHVKAWQDRRIPARTAALEEWRGWTAWIDGLQASSSSPVVVQVPPTVYQLIDAEYLARYSAVLDNEVDRVNSARMRGIRYVLFIAGLFALSRGQLLVDDDDVVRAVNLVEMCVRNLADLDKVVAVDADTRVRERIFKIIEKAGPGGCLRSDLYKAGAMSKSDLELALATLLDAGRVERAKREGGLGRPPEVYRARM